jgi:cytoskeletal protein RodZ
MSQMSIEFGVGKELRAARLKAELKITEVANDLNLTVDHLTAIEKDNYHELPGNTYVVGFVRSYAKYLGLNDVHMVDRLMQSGLIPSLQPIKPAVETEEKNNGSQKRMVIRLLVGSIIVIVLILSFFTVKNLPESPDIVSVVEEAIVVPEPTKVQNTNADIESTSTEDTKGLTDDEVADMLKDVSSLSEEVQAPVEEKKIKLIGTKPEGSRVMLTALRDAWYQVYNPKTGRVYQNAVLKKGHSVWVQPQKGVFMDIGRPHTMVISVDGKEYGRSGPSWGGVIKKLSTEPTFLIYDYYGEGLHEKSYNRWKRKQEENDNL